jgi:glycosyltransferase involved in cell wall biosynthesis
MRIAQVAPLDERVPPKLYGGTERIVFYLTEELVRLGHHVTLFASGDSMTGGELISCCDVALRLNPATPDPLSYAVMQLEQVRARAERFDVLHFHGSFLHFPLMRALRSKAITTLHGRLDLPDLSKFHSIFPEAALVSISDAQQQPLPRLNWIGTIPHGLPPDLLSFCPTAKGGYLASWDEFRPRSAPIGQSKSQPD